MVPFQLTLSEICLYFRATPLNISQTATDTATVTVKGELETAPKLSNGTSFNDLE